MNYRRFARGRQARNCKIASWRGYLFRYLAILGGSNSVVKIVRTGATSYKHAPQPWADSTQRPHSIAISRRTWDSIERSDNSPHLLAPLDTWNLYDFRLFLRFDYGTIVSHASNWWVNQQLWNLTVYIWPEFRRDSRWTCSTSHLWKIGIDSEESITQRRLFKRCCLLYHPSGDERNGAACHACLYLSETSCELGIYSSIGDGSNAIWYTHAHFTDPIGTFEHSNYDMEDFVALIAGANTTIRLLSYSLPTWNRDWFLFDRLKLP